MAEVTEILMRGMSRADTCGVFSLQATIVESESHQKFQEDTKKVTEYISNPRFD